MNTNTDVFLNLVRAGLWEQDVQLASFGKIDFNEVYRLAEEQSVVGLIAAGIEHIVDVKVPQEVALKFVGSALQLEQRNKAMNQFVGKLIDKMRMAGIYTLLVKGQGIAQCYERPLWRACGDIDFYLSKDNYNRAKKYLATIAEHIDIEDERKLHLGMSIASWIVELHGTLHTDISYNMNSVSDEVYNDLFFNGNVRSWNDEGIQVFLPSPNNDVIIIFNHFINHFYGEGVGLRQICDWCRLLWKYKENIDTKLLEKRLFKMGLYKEWRTFAAFAVDYLGMPIEAMPFLKRNHIFVKKAKKLSELIIKTGNFGINKDNSYRLNNPKWKEQFITFFRRLGEFGQIARIFPINAWKFFFIYVINRIKAVVA